MPSPAATKFSEALDAARQLRRTGLDVRLRPASSEQKQTYFHASLAASVAAWDAYINNVVQDFFLAISNPNDIAFDSIYSVAKANSQIALDRFNTPNWENCRGLLVRCTGYDPYVDWHWPKKRWGVLQVQERLNQILKVRHSFAHGFDIPAYPWTQGPSGVIRLTSSGVGTVEGLLKHLVKRTDKGLVAFAQNHYGIHPGW